jgi:hypothetical protein
MDNAPLTPRTATAVKDVDAAADFILKRRAINKINLLGGSGEPAPWAGTPLQTTTRSTSQAVCAAMVA